jgi:hypothetical protein
MWPMMLFNLGRDEGERGSGLQQISEWIVAQSEPARGKSGFTFHTHPMI